MITLLLLWLTVLLYSFYFAGHLFDLLANVPNWKSGDVNDVIKYRDFYITSSPKNYFFLLVIGTPIISFFALVAVWPIGITVRLLFGTSFIVSVFVLVWSAKFFTPINQYIFSSEEYDEVKLKELVLKWISADYFRLTLIGIGLLTSIIGLNIYLSRV